MDKPSPSFVHAFVQDIFLPVAPDFTMAAFFLITWIKPYAIGKNAPHACVAILILEFMTIHSSAMAFSNMRRRAKLIALIIIYSPLVIMAAFISRSFIPLLAFAWHVFTKINLVARGSAEEKNRAFARWILSLMTFMAVALFVSIMPLPGFGWSGRTVGAELAWTNDSGEKAYYITPAWGAFYFFILAWLEIYVQTHKKKFDEFLKRFARPKEN